MLISIYTPTHNPQFLESLHKSLCEQVNNPQFEWIMLMNNGITEQDIPESIRKDKRVKLSIYGEGTRVIGELKKVAVSRCKGDMVVEVDHDDILAPGALYALQMAYEKYPQGFYYSDFINLKENSQCEIYSTKYGWEHYKVDLNSEHYTVNKAFLPTARALCEIFYAPNHVRAWSRTAYDKSGGYDDNLQVCDDHDLVCRTYLAQVPFIYINAPLYIYRRHKQNSFVQYNKLIQQGQLLNKHKYLHKLIYEECRRKGLKVCDVSEIFCSREQKIDNIGCIRANNFLNHVTDLASFFNYCYSVLAPGGWLLTSTPSHTITKDIFKYFTDKKYSNMLKNNISCFQNVRQAIYHQKDKRYLITDLCALKGQRQPGKCDI